LARSGTDSQADRYQVRLLVTVLTTVVMVMALVASAAPARPGQLDRTFGARGKVTTAVDFGIGTFWAEVPVHLAGGPDGEIVISGQDQIARYLPNGRLDRSFGANGVVTIGGVEGLLFFVSDLAVDRTGRVVVFGTAIDNSVILEPAFLAYPTGALSPSYATIIRYLPDGSLDTAFGGGDGIVRTDFGIPPTPPYEQAVVKATTGAVDRWNRPVLIAGAIQVGSPCVGHSRFVRIDELIGRLTEAGDLDLSFGAGDGTTAIHGVTAVPNLVFGNRREIELAAFPYNECRGEASIALIRLTEGGEPDAAFGSVGARFYRRGGLPQRIAVDRFDRALVLAGQSVFRFKANGNLDHSFGRGGEAAVNLPNNQSELNDLAVDARGRPLIVGTLVFRGKRPGPRYKSSRRWITVIRLRADGKPDRRFGSRGWVATRVGRRSDAVGAEAFVERGERLVVGGTAISPDLRPTGGFALARYRLGN
jgi:uncharacterized delta-60 repeat protein